MPGLPVIFHQLVQQTSSCKMLDFSLEEVHTHQHSFLYQQVVEIHDSYPAWASTRVQVRHKSVRSHWNQISFSSLRLDVHCSIHWHVTPFNNRRRSLSCSSPFWRPDGSHNGGKQEGIKCTWGTHEDWSGRQKSSNMRRTWVQCFLAVTNSILAIMAHLIPTAKQPRQGTLYSWGEIQAISKYKAEYKEQTTRALRANMLQNKILVDLFNYWDVQNMLPSDEVESMERVKVSLKS